MEVHGMAQKTSFLTRRHGLEAGLAKPLTQPGLGESDNDNYVKNA